MAWGRGNGNRIVQMLIWFSHKIQVEIKKIPIIQASFNARTQFIRICLVLNILTISFIKQSALFKCFIQLYLPQIYEFVLFF